MTRMAQTSSGLGPWLAEQSSAMLLELLSARPDAAVAPTPANPSELAARLDTARSVQRALVLLTLPALQVAEALLALGGRAPHAELVNLLGVASDVDEQRLDDALAELTRLALVWPLGGELRLAGSMRQLMPYPLGLGGPAKALFNQLTLVQLERIGSALGFGGHAHKSGWVDALAKAVADPEAVTARLGRARPELVEAVERIAWHGPLAAQARLPRARERPEPHAVGLHLALHGWVVAGEWGEIGEMPCEVALAVRGPSYRAPFDPAPPPPATAPVDAARLHEAMRQAAGTAVDAARRLLAVIDRAPPAMVQAGGVGVRELRRVAKQLGTDEAGVRLWLELAACVGLVGSRGEDVVLTTAADGWREADPSAALADLINGWCSLAVVPGHRVDDAGKPTPALGWGHVPFGAALLRSDLLGELAALVPHGLADPGDVEQLGARLAHRRPVLHGHPAVLAPRLRATLAEAGALGLVADGALTELGAQVLAAADTDDPAAAIAETAAGLLPPPASTARFLPDLTVVVGGTVAAALSGLLDEVADAESRDTASTWRFSPASVRRALDGGRDADALLAALTAVAENPLPQPLEYLVRDVARRHGQLAVLPAACCVVAGDRALAAEVAAHRKLTGLKLRLLGDAVLVSAKNAVETLAALRAAGYAPVQRDASGTTVIDRVPPRRVEQARTSPTQIAAEFLARRPGPDLSALARRISGRP